jgi:hypothetical protein
MNRTEFRETVFSEDKNLCVICDKPAVDAHHIMDRALFPDGGYVIENGASLCEECHWKAETTEISPDEIRKAGHIYKVINPPQLPSDNHEKYDKWGNLYISKNSPLRIPGEMFAQENVQKALKKGNQLQYFLTDTPKYPRTYHLPESAGLQNDDRRISHLKFLEGQEIVITEKMDGENTTFTPQNCYARSPDGRTHPSRSWVRSLHGQIVNDIPLGWRICGENLYAKHSISYKNLPSYFMSFAIFNSENTCLSWEDTEHYAELLGLETAPVLYKGPWDMKVIQKLIKECELKNETIEGFVVRVAEAFPFTHFGLKMAKYVRKGHVQTSQHWMHEEIIPNKLK